MRAAASSASNPDLKYRECAVEYAVKTEGLSKSFNGVDAINNVNLRIPAGVVFGLLGPNGAGKTTIMRTLLGLARPSKGAAFIFDLDVRAHRPECASLTGAMIETPALYDRLTGRENLEVARLLVNASRSQADNLLAEVGLTRDADKLVKNYSQGMKQRLSLARALLGRPKLLILDEPTNGLDPEGILAFRELVMSLPDRHQITVLISSHLLKEVEEVASHIAILDKGRLVVQGKIDTLKARSRTVAIIAVDEVGKASEILLGRNLTCRVVDTCHVEVDLFDENVEQTLKNINKSLVQSGVIPYGLRVIFPSLEEIYMSREISEVR